MSETKPPTRQGRPTQKEIQAKTPGGRGKVGRPKGDAAIINEYKARMLASPRSESVLTKIYDVALDDEHKHQASCMKMLIDRILPISHFEKDRGDKAITGVSITINTAAPDEIAIKGETLDHVED